MSFIAGMGINILESIAAQGMNSAITNLIKPKVATAVLPKVKVPGIGPEPAPMAAATTQEIADAAASAAVRAITQNPDVTLVKVKPMSKSVEGWAAVTGAVALIGDYAPNILHQVGVDINGNLGDAVESVTSAIGLPHGTGKAAVVIITLGSLVVVWVRKRWFNHTITPEAANRAVAQGKAI